MRKTNILNALVVMSFSNALVITIWGRGIFSVCAKNNTWPINLQSFLFNKIDAEYITYKDFLYNCY